MRHIILLCVALGLADTQSFGFRLCKGGDRDSLNLLDAPCRCSLETALETHGVIIDCSNNLYDDSVLENETFPNDLVAFDMSFNRLETLPDLASDTLRVLSVAHNRITKLADYELNKLTHLELLDASHNEVQTLAPNAFHGLHRLEVLNLSHNRIAHLPINVFSPLLNLQSLAMSYNPLNATFDDAEVDLVIKLGATPQLRVLKVESCNLTLLDVAKCSGLEELYVQRNLFASLRTIPRSLRLLDASGNPITQLSAHFLSHVVNLETLSFRDMPFLQRVEEFSLHGLPRLKYLSFEGSRNLTYFDGLAFGSPFSKGDDTEPTLETLVLRGAQLTALNESMKFFLRNLKALDLAGNPISCDCNMRWVRELELDTDAQCTAPERLEGYDLAQVAATKYECDPWPQWVYTMCNGLLILFLLTVCGGAIFLLVMRLRPSRKRGMHPVGPQSPYAPITSIQVRSDRADDSAYY